MGLGFLTLTVTQSENGIVTKTRINENMVRSIAHTPGPSGSAENKKTYRM